MAGLFLTVGCKKPENDLGLNLLDPSDTLAVISTDTAKLIAWSVQADQLTTTGLTKFVLGSYLDPLFGEVRAGFATQMRLSASNVGEGQEGQAVCDSIVLQLAFNPASYGYGSLDPQFFKVFELGEDLSVDSAYKSRRVPAFYPADLIVDGRGQFTPDPYNGPVIGEDTLVPQLRIPLKQSLGIRIAQKWGDPEMADNTAFLSFFKGLVVLPANEALTPWQRGVLSLDVASAATKVTFYYNLGGDNDSLHFDFLINSSSVHYNIAQFDHDAALDPGLPMELVDSTLGEQHTYMQSLGGIRTELSLPELSHYAAEGKVVARAQLVLPIDEEQFALYQPPADLFVFRTGEEGANVQLPDYKSSGGYLGQALDKTKGEYRFNVTRWVQGVLNGTYTNNGLYFLCGSSGVTVNRVRMSGPKSPSRPMRLELTFTAY